MAPSTSPLGPLNPGNVVSAGLRLYRDRFKTYFALSIKAILWLFVPIYGWAKYFMLTGVMARLAFRELINQPETPEQARLQVAPKLWSFFGLGLLILLIFFGLYFGLILVAVMVGIIVGLLAAGLSIPLVGSDIGSALGVVMGSVIGLALFFIGLIWIVSRLLIAEVPLAIEPQVTATEGISRSWELTKLSVIRIQFVVLAAFLITLPIILTTNTIPQLAIEGYTNNTPAYWTLNGLGFLLSLIGNVLTLPFWQAVKGVLYYDLRSRREGLDLKI